MSKYKFWNFCTTSVQALYFARSLHHSFYPTEEADPTSPLEILSTFYSKPNATTGNSSTTMCRHLPQNQATEKPRLTHSCACSSFSRSDENWSEHLPKFRKQVLSFARGKAFGCHQPRLSSYITLQPSAILSANPNPRSEQNLSDSLGRT